MQKEKLWTKDFILISIVNFAMAMSMYLLLVTMATYAKEKYDASASLAGLVASIFIIGALLGRLYAGRKIQEVGNKKIMIGGILLFLVVTFFYFIPSNIYVLICIRLLHGVGVGIATTASGTIVGQIIPLTRKGEGIGYFSLSNVLSTAIGPLLGIWLMAEFGYVSIILFSLVMAIASLLLSFPVKSPIVKTRKTNQKGFKFSSLFDSYALPISVVTMVVAFAYSGILSFISEYAISLKLAEVGGLYFLVYAIVIFLSRPFTGKLMDSKGGNSVAYPGLLLFAIGMFVLSQANTILLFLLAAAIIGVGYGNFQSCTQALAIKVTPPERIGLANSTYFIFLDIGLGLGPFILGYLEPSFGYSGLYLALVPVIFFGIFVYYLLHGKKDKELTTSFKEINVSK